MHNSTYFRDWLFNTYKPCALVYSSQKAKNIINKNNISPADFLRPLGDFQGRQISYPYNDKENITIPNFHLDFFDNDKFQKIENEKILQYIITMFVFNQPKWDLSTPTVNKYNFEPYLNNIKYNSTIWYREFEKTLFECLKFDDYECLQQPLINIFICSIEEETKIITEEYSKGIPKLIFEERYDSPSENIIILINDKNTDNKQDKKDLITDCVGSINDTETSENSINLSYDNEDEKNKDLKEKQNKEKEKNNNEKDINDKINKFKASYKKFHIIYWEINKSNIENNETDKIYRKYLHRTDLYNPDNDFFRKNDVILGKYISMNDIIEFKEDFFKYITNIFLNKILEQINDYNNKIKVKKGGFKNFFKSSNKNLDSFYCNTHIYKFNELERCYYNLGLIHLFLHQYNYSIDFFKSFSKAMKEKSQNHRNRVLELLMIIRFLNSKKDFDISGEIKKLPDYNLEQEIKLELLSIKMYENSIGQRLTSLNLNLIKNSIYNFIEKKFERKNSLSCMDYVCPILYEKISIYLLKLNKFRNFTFYMAITGSNFNKLYKEMKPYALYSLSQLLFVLDNPNQSFIDFREYYNNKLGMGCNDIKYYEGGLKFFRNCLKFSYLNNKEMNNNKQQNIYLNFYINNASKIFQEKLICDNINISDVCVPLVDNRSLFILEENDYNIKVNSELIFESEKSWKGFFKYNVKLLGDPYNDLDENDLNHVSLIHDISNNLNFTKSNITTKASVFNGNINQKLYVQFNMNNPLSIELVISSVKLLCEFIPDNEENINNNNPFICNEKNFNLKQFETIKIVLEVQGLVPGKIIIRGLELVLFKDCKIIHYFNKKGKKLYSYRKKSLSSQESESSIDMNTSDSFKANRSFIEKDKTIYSKRIIEYVIKDYKDDLFVNFPMGLNISLYLYQLLQFPIVITNNSNENRVKRFTLFIENCSNQKLYTFFNYITKEIHLNKENPTTTVYIPILPIFRDDIYIKLLIKLSDEKRIKPIPVKIYLIKISVKRSAIFEFKETCYNFFSDKNKKIDVNLKVDSYLKNNDEFTRLILKEPILNKKYNLLSKKNNETNDDKIHMNYYFERNNGYVEEIIKEDSDDEEEERIRKRDYSEIIKNFGIFLCDKNNANNVNISNNHIYDVFNDMIKKKKYDVIIFPWEAKLIKKEEEKNEEIKEIDNNINNKIEEEKSKTNIDEKSIRGIYIYDLKLKNPNISKNYIRDLFYNSTKLEPIVKKINKDKSLIIINITINKTGLIPLGKDIEKYDIFIDENTPLITWFGPNRITVLNHIDNEGDNIAHCKFTFYTSQKGLIEVNRICVLLYKRFEGMAFSTGIIQINHITKPLYLEI